MSQFLPLGTSWLNVDKIVFVDFQEHPVNKELSCSVTYVSGANDLRLHGEQAKALFDFLNKHKAD